MSSLPDVSLGGAPAPPPAASGVGEMPSDLVAGQVTAAEPVPEPALEVTQGTEAQVTSLALPNSDLAGGQVTRRERVQAMLRHWLHQSAAGAPSGGVWDARPESLAQYRTYVRSRAWLPNEYNGRVLLWVTVGYYNTIGTAGVSVGYAIAWLFARMLRINVAAAVAALAAALWLLFG